MHGFVQSAIGRPRPRRPTAVSVTIAYLCMGGRKIQVTNAQPQKVMVQGWKTSDQSPDNDLIEIGVDQSNQNNCQITLRK